MALDHKPKDSDSSSGPGIACVHLIRQTNGIDPFRAFLQSYRRHPAGIAHRLLLIFKGFGAVDTAPYEALLEGVAYRRIDWPGDEGFDIGPYLWTAQTEPDAVFCFLNSFSVILANDWLAKLYRALTEAPGAGLVGCSGSWESSGPARPFPNPHIRTNGFMISRCLLLSLDLPRIVNKGDAHAFECGPQGLTLQTQSKGLVPYVVDRNGKAWALTDCPDSRTFRLGDQEGLMLADNRTRAYQEADAAGRRYLAKLAWSREDPGKNPFKRKKSLGERIPKKLRRWIG